MAEEESPTAMKTCLASPPTKTLANKLWEATSWHWGEGGFFLHPSCQRGKKLSWAALGCSFWLPLSWC